MAQVRNINEMIMIRKAMTPDPVNSDSGLHIDIDVRTDAWREQLNDIEAISRRTLGVAWMALKFSPRPYEVSLVLGDDDLQRALNAQYLGKDTSTNVLSFPSDQLDVDGFPDEAAVPLGDIILAFETVKFECEKDEVSFSDHFCHLIVHGILHLAGYDHVVPAEAEIMESLEIEILSKLGIKNPYADGILLDHG